MILATTFCTTVVVILFAMTLALSKGLKIVVDSSTIRQSASSISLSVQNANQRNAIGLLVPSNTQTSIGSVRGTNVWTTDYRKRNSQRLPIEVKALLTPMPDHYSQELQEIMSDGDDEPYRKRKRLTHLTPEQKNLRRKLKNRVAAQTARDRRKKQYDQLEERVEKLDKLKKEILAENAAVKQELKALLAENLALRTRLNVEEPYTPMSTRLAFDVKSEQLESAVFQSSSLQKEHALTSRLTQIKARQTWKQTSRLC